jgi:hypothetical protein
MTGRQIIINEADLDQDSLRPTETFARLVKQVGDQAQLGTLGLGAIEKVVRNRAHGNSTPADTAPFNATARPAP